MKTWDVVIVSERVLLYRVKVLVDAEAMEEAREKVVAIADSDEVDWKRPEEGGPDLIVVEEIGEVDGWRPLGRMKVSRPGGQKYRGEGGSPLFPPRSRGWT